MVKRPAMATAAARRGEADAALTHPRVEPFGQVHQEIPELAPSRPRLGPARRRCRFADTERDVTAEAVVDQEERLRDVADAPLQERTLQRGPYRPRNPSLRMAQQAEDEIEPACSSPRLSGR